MIKYCTRFTDDVFNALLGGNFVYEALKALRANFMFASKDLTLPFVEASLALSTFFVTNTLVGLRKTTYFTSRVRSLLADFAPVIAILSLSFANNLGQLKKFHIPTLPVPHTFQLANARPFLVDLSVVPPLYRLLAAIPALFLTALFFFDQNISVRTVNSALQNGCSDNSCDIQEHHVKGQGYSLDMLALAALTAGVSVVGLPWVSLSPPLAQNLEGDVKCAAPNARREAAGTKRAASGMPYGRKVREFTPNSRRIHAECTPNPCRAPSPEPRAPASPAPPPRLPHC